MTVSYENVVYKQGKIVKETNPPGFAAHYYDSISGPVVVGANSANAELASQGLAPGETEIFNSNNRNNPNYFVPNNQPNPGPSQSQLDKAATLAQATYTGPASGNKSNSTPGPLGFKINTGVQLTANQTQATPVKLTT